MANEGIVVFTVNPRFHYPMVGVSSFVGRTSIGCDKAPSVAVVAGGVVLYPSRRIAKGLQCQIETRDVDASTSFPASLMFISNVLLMYFLQRLTPATTRKIVIDRKSTRLNSSH